MEPGIKLSSERTTAVDLTFVGLLAVFAASELAAAARKAFWYDELFTYYVADASDARDVVDRLAGGMDNHPPLSYLVFHLIHRLLGSVGRGEVVFRLPALCSFAGATVLIYLLLRRRGYATAGLVAAASFATGPGLQYAVEARPYALLLFFAAALLYLSDARRHGRAWTEALLACAAFLSGAVHYYGLLALTPLALSDLCLRGQTAPRGRLLSILPYAAGAAGAASALPWALGSRDYAPSFWARPGDLVQLASAFGRLFESAGLTLVMALVGAIAAGAEREPVGSSSRLALLAVGALSIPALGWVASALTGGPFSFHYFLFAGAGCAVALGQLVMSLSPAAARILPGVLVLSMVGSFVLERSRATDEFQRASLSSVRRLNRELVALARTDGVVVFDSALEFLRAWHYVEPARRASFAYVADTELEREFLTHDTLARSLRRFARFVDIPLLDHRALADIKGRLVLVSRSDSPGNWVVRYLLDSGRPMRLVHQHGPHVVYEAAPR